MLISTPCFGGFVTAQYLASAIKLETELSKAQIDHDWLISWNESLITRGRDKMARTFLEDTQFERLLFIDSDIQFSPEDVAKLWNLNADIGVGAYRNKKMDQVKGAWVNGKLIPLSELSEPTEVNYAGTGFMMIKRGVFEALKSKYDWSYEDATGGELKQHFAFFQDPVEDHTKLSEDYFFCKRARESGFKVILDPSINLTHWGQFGY